MTCSLRLGSYNRQFISPNGIHQSGFPHIWITDNTYKTCFVLHLLISGYKETEFDGQLAQVLAKSVTLYTTKKNIIFEERSNQGLL